MTKHDRELSCPSTSAADPDAKVFGIVVGSALEPEVVYLDQLESLAALPTLPDVPVTEMYRLVGTCTEGACAQWSGARCGLGRHVARELPAVVERLPSCSIRRSCRWFAEERAQACLRCPQVVTDTRVSLSEMARRARRQLPVVSW
jgi:hypothetical protein